MLTLRECLRLLPGHFQRPIRKHLGVQPVRDDRGSQRRARLELPRVHRQEVEVLQEELQNMIGRRVNLKVEEIARPEVHAQLVAEDIAQQLAKRASFRRTMKRAMESTMDAGARGIKIQLAGRLGGAEMARCEKSTAGSLPLSTLRARIDYGFTEAMTAQGHIGVQVWINNGMFDGEQNDGPNAEAGQAQKKPKRSYKR